MSDASWRMINCQKRNEIFGWWGGTLPRSSSWLMGTDVLVPIYTGYLSVRLHVSRRTETSWFEWWRECCVSDISHKYASLTRLTQHHFDTHMHLSRAIPPSINLLYPNSTRPSTVRRLSNFLTTKFMDDKVRWLISSHGQIKKLELLKNPLGVTELTKPS